VKRFIILLLILFLFSPNGAGADNENPEEMLKKNFPGRNFESVSPTPVKGLYEIYTGNQIIYYAPEANILIYGNMITKEGKNLTRENYLKKMAGKMAHLPLDTALKIGSGKNIVVEFMDPDCHFCRESYKFFSQRKDVTIYVFFYPISQVSEKKIRYILCAADQVKAYDEVMSGKHDNDPKLVVCADKKVEETLKNYRKLAGQIGLRSTPIFYFKGRVIDGFERPVWENLLKN